MPFFSSCDTITLIEALVYCSFIGIVSVTQMEHVLHSDMYKSFYDLSYIIAGKTDAYIVCQYGKGFFREMNMVFGVLYHAWIPGGCCLYICPLLVTGGLLRGGSATRKQAMCICGFHSARRLCVCLPWGKPLT